MTTEIIERSTLGIIGFGAFGQLLARHLQPYFRILAFDPSSEMASFFADGVLMTGQAEASACDVVVFAVPVERLRDAIVMARPFMKEGAVILDVGSVKMLTADVMEAELPSHVHVVGTHPLFGPQSARDGIHGKKIAVCHIRGSKTARTAAFLRHALKLNVYRVTPEDHDREAAAVQGLTHLIAKVIVEMEPLPTRMTTKSFELIMQAVEMVRYDAPEVFLAIEKSNPFSKDLRNQFFDLAMDLRDSLEAGDHADG
jgi:prephenate dehydrogenase